MDNREVLVIVLTRFDREAEIQAVMANFGLDRSEATAAVAIVRGESDGDVVTPGLSREQRKRLGLHVSAFDDIPDDES